MNIKTATACFLAAALMLPIVGYSADGDADRSDGKAFVKDSIITTKIKAKLAREKLSTMTHVKVDTDNKGIVSLSGEAKSQKAVNRAGVIAHSVKGVKSVHNEIAVKTDL